MLSKPHPKVPENESTSYLIQRKFHKEYASWRRTISKLNSVAQQKVDLENDLDGTNGKLEDTRNDQNGVTTIGEIVQGYH